MTPGNGLGFVCVFWRHFLTLGKRLRLDHRLSILLQIVLRGDDGLSRTVWLRLVDPGRFLDTTSLIALLMDVVPVAGLG